tara:strand:+ start:93 stop:269 length:177 start_codon:yes stop_codon:yes gene_type:complete
MAIIDLRKAQKGVSGQKITPMYPTQNNNNEIEKRVDNLENKLDAILNLLENKKDKKND